MTLRSEFILHRSEFNEFLYAPVGCGENGLPITVLSVLARLNVDPWREAARLADLPKDMAIAALTKLIALIPETQDWLAWDARTTAVRLIGVLPRRRELPLPALPRPKGRVPSTGQKVLIGVIFCLIVAISMLSSTPSSNRTHAPEQTGDSTTPIK